jgi:hypothetical protein
VQWLNCLHCPPTTIVRSDTTHAQVVFVSGDKSEAEFDEYFGMMPWLALPFADQAVRAGLSNMFQVRFF